MNAVIYVDVYVQMNTGVNVSQCIIVPTVTQSHTGLQWQTNRELYIQTGQTVLSSLFSAFRKCLKLQNWYVLLCL